MIKIFSTYTKDKIYNQDKNLKIVHNGGPAFFIENVFKKNKIKYKIASQQAVIEIKIKNSIEKGILKNKLKEKRIRSANKNDIVIISTVDNEWILDGKLTTKAQVFLDVQGYVRSARKNPKIYKANFWDSVFYLKANSQEIKELSKKIVSNQKNKCLIITKGNKGALVYFKNKRYVFAVKKMKLSDTIGAGDTFFAGFIAGFIKSKGDVVRSGKFAIKEAENFLLTKQKYK